MDSEGPRDHKGEPDLEDQIIQKVKKLEHRCIIIFSASVLLIHLLIVMILVIKELMGAL